MKIKVVRDIFTNNTTTSKIYIDDVFVCFGLEDKVRSDNETKIHGETAVPYGVYQVQLRKEGTIYENLCSRNLGIRQERGTLHIYNITGVVYPKWYNDYGIQRDAYVLIHIGNTKDDTLGCLLTGGKRGTDCLIGGTSTNAYCNLYVKVADALEKGETVTIEYTK